MHIICQEQKNSKATVLQLQMWGKNGGNTEVLLFLLWLIIGEPLSAWSVNAFKNTLTTKIHSWFLISPQGEMAYYGST